eukprot:m.251156 g.251156  ORF g.251156 m.251156 type:complete len:501 (-) comp17087_c0_seq1:108-1610(-)
MARCHLGRPVVFHPAVYIPSLCSPMTSRDWPSAQGMLPDPRDPYSSELSLGTLIDATRNPRSAEAETPASLDAMPMLVGQHRVVAGTPVALSSSEAPATPDPKTTSVPHAPASTKRRARSGLLDFLDHRDELRVRSSSLTLKRPASPPLPHSNSTPSSPHTRRPASISLTCSDKVGLGIHPRPSVFLVGDMGQLHINSLLSRDQSTQRPTAPPDDLVNAIFDEPLYEYASLDGSSLKPTPGFAAHVDRQSLRSLFASVRLFSNGGDAFIYCFDCRLPYQSHPHGRILTQVLKTMLGTEFRVRVILLLIHETPNMDLATFRTIQHQDPALLDLVDELKPEQVFFSCPLDPLYATQLELEQCQLARERLRLRVNKITGHISNEHRRGTWEYTLAGFCTMLAGIHGTPIVDKATFYKECDLYEQHYHNTLPAGGDVIVCAPSTGPRDRKPRTFKATCGHPVALIGSGSRAVAAQCPRCNKPLIEAQRRLTSRDFFPSMCVTTT